MELVGITEICYLCIICFQAERDERYSFKQALDLAKKSNHMKATEILQQIIDEPVAFMYDRDQNNNFSMNIDSGATALMIANFNEDWEMIEKLLEYKADPNIKNSGQHTAVMYSCRNAKIARLLIDNGANIKDSDVRKDNVLTWASFVGNVKLVKLLLEYDHSKELIEMKREDQETPLFLASSNGHLSVVKCLLQKKADPNIPGPIGETPLYTASSNGHVAVVQCLIRNKADPNIPYDDGETPLYAASREGHTPIVKCLLREGADPCARKETGLTPLSIACLEEHLPVVELLLSQKLWIQTLKIMKEGVLCGLLASKVAYLLFSVCLKKKLMWTLKLSKMKHH